MILVLKMALRNLSRSVRKSLITVTLTALSVAVILWLQCILRGQNGTVIETVTSTFYGRMQLTNPEFPKDRLLQYTLPDTIPDALRHIPPDIQGVQFTRRVYIPALISSGEQSIPIQLIGIDPEGEASVTKLKTYLTKGSYLVPGDGECKERQVFLGDAAAQMLGVGEGDKIVVLAQATDGTLGNDLLRVKGIFDSGSRAFDKSVVYTTLDCAQKVAAVHGVHEITLRVPKEDQVPALKRYFWTSLGPNYAVQTWREAMPVVGAVVEYNDALLLLIGGMLYVVIALGMINTLLINVFERTHEFGVMIALGTPPGRVIGMVLIESILLGGVAVVIGTALGLLLVAYHSIHGFDISPFTGKNMVIGQFKMEMIVFPEFRWIPFAKAILSTLSAVCLAALYPAIRTSRLDPIVAIREN